MSLALHTERLVLHELVAEDRKAIYTIFREPEVVQYTEWNVFRDTDDAGWLVDWARDAAKQMPRTVYAFAIMAEPEDAMVGVGTLVLRDADYQIGALGYIIGRPWWGQGFATEAARGLLRFGFAELNLHRIYAECRPANGASARVLEKIGMRQEGHLRQHRWEKGAWQDSLVYALLREEWSAEKK